MKKTVTKILSLLLVLSMLFAISSVPASAVNVYEENYYKGLKEVYDFGNKEDKNFFEKISDTFHWYMARLFVLFEADCPICGEHFIAPNLENDIEFYYNQAINYLKNYKGTVHLTKKTTITDIKITNTSAQVAQTVLDSVAKNFLGTSKTSYIFLNGEDYNGTKITDVVQPLGREACLNPEGTKSSFARMSDNIGGIESITVSIVEESSVYDGTVVHKPVYNSGIIDTLNPATLEINPVLIKNATIRYPETISSITFDKKGRVDSINISMPIDVELTYQIASGIMSNANCKADIIEKYDFTYIS